MSFTYKDSLAAYERIKPYFRETPLEKSYYLGDKGTEVFFKLESLQKAKSFKIRGALNKMLQLTDEERERGVCTISSGNHGSSVSYAASLLGIKRAEIIVPENVPDSKAERIEYFGGHVLRMGHNYDGAHELGMKYVKESNLTFVDSYFDDPKIYAGQGTIAVEILKQNPEIDTIVVPVGGGGMLTGIAVAAKGIKKDIRVIGVQTEACPALKKAYEDGVFYEAYPTEESICDATIGGIGALCYEMAKDYVDDIILVSEESVGKAVSFMARKEKYIAEPSSCLTVAAMMDYKEKIGGKKVALVISGGNIDGDLLAKLLNTYTDF